MGKTPKCFMLSLLLAFVASTFALSQTADPFIGTWKLNVAKSKFDPGPPPKSATRTYEDRGGGVTLFTQEGINAQGDRTFAQWAAKNDGKDYPYLVLGAKAAQSVSRKAIDAYTVEGNTKTDGKVTATYTVTISKDGKTMTQTYTSSNAVHVYERQ